MKPISIGYEAAIALSETGWWKGLSHHEIAERQLFTEELCCPFAVFHEAVEGALGRPVWTHEFGLGAAKLRAELLGEREPPTMRDILEMIPEEKRLLVVTDGPDQDDEAMESAG